MRSGAVTTTFLTKFPRRLIDALPQEHLGNRAIARERLMKSTMGKLMKIKWPISMKKGGSMLMKKP